MYDPIVGRWLSVDPKGFDAGDANLYRYVKNDPANAIDPTGLYMIVANAAAQKDYTDWLNAQGLDVYWAQLPSGRVYLAIPPFQYEELRQKLSSQKPVSARVIEALTDQTGTLLFDASPDTWIVNRSSVSKRDLRIIRRVTNGWSAREWNDDPRNWEKTVRDAISPLKADGYGLVAHILEHFLAQRVPLAEGAVGTQFNRYIIPDRYKLEVQKHSELMIQQILSDYLSRRWSIGKAPTVGEKFRISVTKVRWFSENVALNIFETMTNSSERYQETDEHLFRAYGGAYITISGIITGIGKVIGTDPPREWRVRATVTIDDDADFNVSGVGRLRHKIPYGLGSVYLAAYRLQAAGIHPRYWHRIVFTSMYKAHWLFR